MKVLLSALFTISCISLSSLAFAAHPLATDDTGTQGTMKFQVETSAEFAWDKEARQGITTKSSYQTLNATVTAGVLDALDLALSYPYTWQKIQTDSVTSLDNSGLNDLTVALKLRFLELGPASFAIKPSITFPTGNRERSLGVGRAAYGVTLISTVEFKPVAVHANFGYTNQKYTDADSNGLREHLWNLSLAGSVEIIQGLQLVTEIVTASNPDRRSNIWPIFMSCGMIYSIIDNLDLSLGAKVGLTDPATDMALLTGITFKFP